MEFEADGTTPRFEADYQSVRLMRAVLNDITTPPKIISQNKIKDRTEEFCDENRLIYGFECQRVPQQTLSALTLSDQYRPNNMEVFRLLWVWMHVNFPDKIDLHKNPFSVTYSSSLLRSSLASMLDDGCEYYDPIHALERIRGIYAFYMRNPSDRKKIIVGELLCEMSHDVGFSLRLPQLSPPFNTRKVVKSHEHDAFGCVVPYRGGYLFQGKLASGGPFVFVLSEILARTISVIFHGKGAALSAPIFSSVTPFRVGIWRQESVDIGVFEDDDMFFHKFGFKVDFSEII